MYCVFCREYEVYRIWGVKCARDVGCALQRLFFEYNIYIYIYSRGGAAWPFVQLHHGPRNAPLSGSTLDAQISSWTQAAIGITFIHSIEHSA